MFNFKWILFQITIIFLLWISTILDQNSGSYSPSSSSPSASSFTTNSSSSFFFYTSGARTRPPCNFFKGPFSGKQLLFYRTNYFFSFDWWSNTSHWLVIALTLRISVTLSHSYHTVPDKLLKVISNKWGNNGESIYSRLWRDQIVTNCYVHPKIDS